MSLSHFCRRLFAAALVVAASASFAADFDIIAKARERLGGEQALNSVKSIHYTGTLTLPGGNKVALEIIIQSPLQQRLTVTTNDRITITGLDDFDGWQRTVDVKDSTRWNLTLLGKDQLKRLRANTFENLNFFKIQGFPGQVEDLGQVTVDGVVYRKLRYKYDANISFLRYFDPATGRLAFSETDEGMTIKEEGEILANGIRFAKRIYSSKNGKVDSPEAAVIEFDKITVNESFASSLFLVPMAR